jgi:hypothetical protein
VDWHGTSLTEERTEMNIKVVTTYNNELYNKYAHRFFNTYNWPFEIMSYNEDKNMFNLIPECKNFIDRNANRQVKNFRFDGVRFCYKVYAYTHAMLNENIDGLICMDADCVFYKPIDINFIKNHLHKDDHMMAYMGRYMLYSECGFLYFNLQHPETKNFAREMQEMYNQDKIYKLNEYHDSFVWDTVRKQFEKNRGVKNIDITNNSKMEHAQAGSVLCKYYDHCKGDRKILGLSPENKHKTKETK